MLVTLSEPSTRRNHLVARIREAFIIHEGDFTRTVELVGRDAWALNKLLDAGAAGCTPLDQPAHYVWKLRQKLIDVATITEDHGGPYSGHHARYVLRSNVSRLDGNNKPPHASRTPTDLFGMETPQ